MKCYIHSDINAVSTCECGKALCSECTDKYYKPICDSCVSNINENQKSYYIKCYILMAVFFVIALTSATESPLLTALLFSGVPWGWITLNKIQPRIFLFMPIIGWALYFLTKLTLAYLIGIIVTPFQIYKSIKVFKLS